MSDVVPFKSKSSVKSRSSAKSRSSTKAQTGPGVDLDGDSKLREQAALWLVRLQEGLSPAQAEELSAWLDDDQTKQEHLLELASLWDDMGVLTELAPIFERPAAKLDSPSRNWFVGGLKVASLLVFSLVAGLFSMQYLPVEPPTLETPSLARKPIMKQAVPAKVSVETYGTKVGEHSEVLLSDGSIVTLNTDSQIAVDFSQQNRKIQLLAGEVHIDVVKDPSRPLSIIAGTKAVQAVGTAFSVRKYANESGLEVAVDEGTVAVFKEYSGAELVADNAWRSLQVGEVLRIVDNTQSIRVIDTEELADRLAWKAGMIVINDETLDYVIQEFGRHSHKKMILADAKMQNIRVAGYFRLGDIPALLVALDQNFGISSEYNREEDSFILSQR